MANSDWVSYDEPVSAQVEGWKSYDEPEQQEKTYNVDLSSKVALANNQMEMIKRHPDFINGTPQEKAKMLRSASSAQYKAKHGSEYDKAMEIPRFAAEIGTMFGGAINRGVGSAVDAGKALYTAGKEYATTDKGVLESLDTGAAEYNATPYSEKGVLPKEAFETATYGIKPSQTGQAIGEILQPAVEGVAEWSGDTELGNKLMDLTILGLC